MGSAIEAAEGAIKAAIVTRQAGPGSAVLDGIPIEMGFPGADVGREEIWVAEEVDSTQVWETSGAGNQQRRETFTVRVNVFVVESGNDFETLRDRVRDITAEIEAAIRADHTLGGAVWHAAVAGVERDSGAKKDARLVQRTVLIDVMAFV